LFEIRMQVTTPVLVSCSDKHHPFYHLTSSLSPCFDLFLTAFLVLRYRNTPRSKQSECLYSSHLYWYWWQENLYRQINASNIRDVN